MAKKRKSKKQQQHTEIRGLILLALSTFFLLSLISFTNGAPKDNWLGALGYYVALSSNYFFGLISYLLVGFSFYVGAKYLINNPFPNKKSVFSYFLLAFSVSILLTMLAENFPQKAHLFEERIYTESITLLSPNPVTITRHNLGGIIPYYLYKDLPLFNLQRLLSPIGSLLIFSFTAFFSFLFLLGVSVKSALYSLGKLAKKLYFATASLASYLMNKARSFELPKKREEPIIPARAPEEKSYFDPPLIKKPRVKIVEQKAPMQKVKVTYIKKGGYHLPSTNLLKNPEPIDHSSLKKDLSRQAQILEETLKNFGISARVVDINCGPTITSFEVQPPIGVKVQKIKALESDIALSMQAKSIRILAPIPGKAVVGVEVPSLQPQPVSFKEMLEHYQQKARKFQIPILLGKTVNGDFVMSDLAKMPHCLIAGATGSGKSVCINTIVMSILMNASPDELKMLMIDPKKVELTQYSNLPHMIAPVISEAHGAYAALQWLVREMNVRYEILKRLGLRNISAFNSRKIKKDVEEASSTPIPEKMPMIVAIIDEFADLMMVSSSDLETPIARIAQMARAVGIHLILATQRPSREVITGIIKANFPTRIAFKVSSRINSQIILDETGAESLLGNGDLLFMPPGSSNLVRAQGSFISDDEITDIVNAISEKNPTNYLIGSFDAMKREEGAKLEGKDALYEQAVEVVLASKSASTTYLQRKLKIGYARAASLIDELEENGIVGPQEGSKPRKVLADYNDLAR